MKRRFVDTRSAALGVFILFAIAALFTNIFLPFEHWLLGRLGYLIVGHLPENIHTLPQEKTLASGEVFVIGKRADEFEDMMLVKGAIALGSRISSGDVLVGIVVEEGKEISKVEEIFSPFRKTQGVIARSGIPVELEGKGAHLFEIKLPHGSDVQVGDTVRETGAASLRIGDVVKIEETPSDPFIRVLVLSAVNTATLKTVFYGA